LLQRKFVSSFVVFIYVVASDVSLRRSSRAIYRSSKLSFVHCFVNSKARHGVVLKGESLFV
jgi:hypothetical protein